VLHIEPLARPLIWGQFHMDAQDANGVNRPMGSRGPVSTD
jgi:hypothetical protein